MKIIVDIDIPISKSFLLFLKKEIKNRFFLTIQLEKLKYIDEKINDQNIFKNKISSLDILLTSIDNIQIYRIDNIGIVQIDDNILYKDLDIPLSSLCKLITFGNINIEGYPILNNVFRYIQSHLKYYRDKFANGG